MQSLSASRLQKNIYRTRSHEYVRYIHVNVIRQPSWLSQATVTLLHELILIVSSEYVGQVLEYVWGEEVATCIDNVADKCLRFLHIVQDLWSTHNIY